MSKKIPINVPVYIQDFNSHVEQGNGKFTTAKLKIFYEGETVDHRLFTKNFSDKILQTLPYTPVVGYYSVADEDFVGHNNVQHIYGLIPADAELAYVEDEKQGVTFAVTDVILYTGRPDETGAVAAKIIGKQHSLELHPDTVKYKINRDEFGAFQNIEFIDGELIGLSVLGDNDTPAFSGSGFFSAEELPEFVTEENKSKYEALFNALINVEPTAQEVVDEIYKTLASQDIYGYVCEHIADKYVVVTDSPYTYKRFLCTRDEMGTLQLTYDTEVRSRFLSDNELEMLANALKGPTDNFEDVTQTQEEPVAGTEATAGSDTSTSTDENDFEQTNEELEALRSSCASLEEANAAMSAQIAALQAATSEFANTMRAAFIEAYKNILNEEKLAECASIEDVEQMISAMSDAYAEQQTNADSSVFEISIIDSTTSTYSEFSEVDVVQKYTLTNRGKN